VTATSPVRLATSGGWHMRAYMAAAGEHGQEGPRERKR
jgi:hypothetical protein